MKKLFRYKHIVGFEETNLVGNVYYSNHVKWQGRCREMFLKEYAPDVVGQLERGEIALVTLSCSCDYYGELNAFDEVEITMELGELKQNRLEMIFTYFKDGEIKAKGRQQIACMKRDNGKMIAVPFPDSMLKALHEFEIKY